MKIKTGISLVHWCEPTSETDENNNIIYEAKKANFREGVFVSWFDELFKGGIKIPEQNDGEKKYPLTILLAGPPGSGKSTLATEFCTRLTNFEKFKSSIDGKEGKGITSLYISVDSTSEQFIESNKAYGWFEDANNAITYEEYEQYKSKLDSYEQNKTSLTREEACELLNKTFEPQIIVYGKDNFSDKEGSIRKSFLKDLKSLCKIASLINSQAKVIAETATDIQERAENERLNDAISNIRPSILVIDNLNIFDSKSQSQSFEELYTQASCFETDIIIFVLNTAPSDTENHFWEYACDIVIKLGSEDRNNYFSRTFEIVKSRYQSQILGKHPFKIIEKTDTNSPIEKNNPYYKDGGIFIFPSLHYYISQFKKLGNTSTIEKTPLDNKIESINQFNKFLENKFIPPGKTTAFVGKRGSHKEHLALLYFLDKLVNQKESLLILSLDKDVDLTKETIKTVLRDKNLLQNTDYVNNEGEFIKKKIIEDSLRILYFPPGYITPEDFCHKVYVNVKKMVSDNNDKKLNVLFNSLDQLPALFPLCAEEKIFVPSIVEFLNAEKDVTSIFIAAEEEKEQTQYGLLPMSDLILSFNHEKEEGEEGVVVKVEKFSGGKCIGNRGIVDNVRETSTEFHGEKGIVFKKK